MDEVKVFAPQEIWDEDFAKFNNDFKSLINFNDGIVKLIYKYIPPVAPDQVKNYYEIGCYLARYMYHYGKLGYTLNGIDQSPDMDEHFTNYLKAEGFKVGDISVGNIFELSPQPVFDVVASFGFVEHFSNFTDLIELHFKLAKPGGYLMITIPNLRGPVQYWLHRLLDKKHLDIHNLEAMKPEIWRECVSKYDHEVIFDDYTGGFDFWIGEQKRNWLQKAMLKIVFFPPLIKRLRKIKRSRRLYSPYYLMILKKK